MFKHSAIITESDAECAVRFCKLRFVLNNNLSCKHLLG